MMNNELSHLHSILPSLQSGLYLLETELTDEEIVNYLKNIDFINRNITQEVIESILSILRSCCHPEVEHHLKCL